MDVLTATSGIDPANWANQPVSCDSSSFPQICTVTGEDGETLTTEAENADVNWVVTAVKVAS